MKNKMLILSICVLIVICIGVLVGNKPKNAVMTSAKIDVSNKKIGWGIQRGKDNKQPNLGANNVKLVEENEGLAIGNKDERNVYLTFDSGYEAGYTEKILDVLKENNVKATFFITGHYLNSAEDLVKRMIDEGHIVGNHTVNHPSMPDLEDEKLKKEIMDLHTKMYQKFGYEMKYLRPPKGEFSERTLLIAKKLEYKTVMWSFAYEDWIEEKQGREEYGKSMIMDNLHSGEIMLLHSTSKDNCEILDYIIKEIKSKGYEFKSLDEFKR